MNIGKAVREVRKKRFPHVNQQEFARRINITQSYLSQIETGDKIPSVELLEVISNEIGMPLSGIMWFATDESDIDASKIKEFFFLKPSIDAFILSIMQ